MALKTINTSTMKVFPSEQYSFENKGDSLDGHLVDVSKLTSKETGKPFNKYTLRTPAGDYVSTLGSHQIDTALAQVKVGTYVRITKDGVKKLGAGRSVGLFTIECDDENTIDVSSLEGDKVALDSLVKSRGAPSGSLSSARAN